MKRFFGISVLALSLIAFGCGTTMHSVKVDNNTDINFVEHRSFWSTTSVAIVRKGNDVIGIAAGTGKPIAGFVSEILGMATIGAALAYVGTQLKTINTGSSKIQIEGGMP